TFRLGGVLLTGLAGDGGVGLRLALRSLLLRSALFLCTFLRAVTVLFLGAFDRVVVLFLLGTLLGLALLLFLSAPLRCSALGLFSLAATFLRLGHWRLCGLRRPLLCAWLLLH